MWSYYTIETFKGHTDDEVCAAQGRSQHDVINKDAVPVLAERHVHIEDVVQPYGQTWKEKITFHFADIQVITMSGPVTIRYTKRNSVDNHFFYMDCFMILIKIKYHCFSFSLLSQNNCIHQF